MELESRPSLFLVVVVDGWAGRGIMPFVVAVSARACSNAYACAPNLPPSSMTVFRGGLRAPPR